MKRITICLLSVTLLAACAKTNKGKLTNEWKITSYQDESYFTSSEGDVSNVVTTMTETSLSQSHHMTDNGNTYDTSNEGTVNSHVLTIRKDGTWTWAKDITYASFDQQYSSEQSGTWSFTGKSKGDDFKKNERILFNILSIKSKTVHISDQEVMSEDTKTFLTGENTMIYTVSESKRKELQLEFDHTMTYINLSGGTDTEKTAQKLTLKEN